MSKIMLNDEDAINDVNPFVKHDFSLPGSVRPVSYTHLTLPTKA